MSNGNNYSPQILNVGDAFVTQSLTIRVGNHISEKKAAAEINRLGITNITFDKETIKALDKRLPRPVEVVQAYVEYLTMLPYQLKDLKIYSKKL